MSSYTNLAIALGIKGSISRNQYNGRCPFHNDTNPSFSMNTETGLWICYTGCGSGDFYRLVELVLNCSPQEARDWISNNGSGTSIEQINKHLEQVLNPAMLTEATDNSWLLYYQSLDSEVMPEWFLDRGFTWDTINIWEIKYDFLNDAIVIPVFWKGEIVGTITRNHKPERPKYKNSPHLPVSRVLFGKFTSGKKAFIIVEGVLDAIWLWQNGYNAAALLTNTISETQVELLRNYRFGDITLALDNDEGGRVGTDQVINKLTQAGWLLPQIKVLNYPDNIKDVQECSPELLVSLMANRRDYIHGIVR